MIKPVKLLAVILLVLSMLVFSSCSSNRSNQEANNDGTLASDDPSGDEEEETHTPSATPDQTENPTSPSPTPVLPENKGEPSEVKREDTIGPAVELADFKEFELNKRLLGIIDDSAPHGIEDYINGIIPTRSAYILNERFKDEIIAGIKLGASFSDITEALGQPGWATDDILLYRHELYYLLFEGNQKAHYAVLMKAPDTEFDKEILKTVIDVLNSEDYLPLDESLPKIDPEGSFFDDQGFINGGGYYLSSKRGINVFEFDENYIEVYNNYQGTLYEPSDKSRFEVRFIDRDMVIDYMLNEFNRYLEIEELFQTEGVVSPDGKLCAVYEWIYSMDHHFIVRTLDHTIQDRYIYASSHSKFFWLTNRYLIYIDPYNNLPYAIDVDFSDPGAINILYEAGVIKERDVDAGIYEYDIVEVKADTVLIKDVKTGKNLTLSFLVDKKGAVSFTVK